MYAAILAAAVGFEQAGHNVVVAEGLAGVASYRVSYPGSNTEPTARLQIGALGMLPYTRLGFHRFLGHGVSLGTGAQYLSAKGSFYYPEALIVGASPRIGWASSLSPAFAVWLRAGPGVTYVSARDTSTGQLSLGAEAIAVFIPAHDLGLTLTAFLDQGFAGRQVRSSTNTSHAVRYQLYGISLGIALAF